MYSLKEMHEFSTEPFLFFFRMLDGEQQHYLMLRDAF
jgi:hypothetical protein